MPTISDVIVANMALSHIGAESSIASLSEDSAEANECNLWMEYSRLQTLEAFDWNFSRRHRYLTLHPHPYPELGQYAFRYVYPSDCIRFRGLVNSVGVGIPSWDSRLRPFNFIDDAIPYQIEFANLDVVANGKFDSRDSDFWTANTGWTIGAGVATASTASTDLEQTIATELTEGVSYTLTFTLTRSAGSVTPKVGGTSGTSRSSDGTYTEAITAGTTDLLEFTGSSFTGTIDDVSLTPATTGRAILTDLEDAVGWYSFDQTDLSVWSPLAIRALSFALANNVAFALTKKSSVKDRAERGFFQSLQLASASNANEGIERRPPDADWIQDR